MGITDEHVKPVVGRFSRFQWVAASVVFGFFLGFVDTLLIACVLGWLGLQVPAYFGVPTTFTGYFFTGWILGDLAPSEIVWELPAGILVCVLLLMWGVAGSQGMSLPYLFLNYVCIPAVAVTVCYLGLRVGRKRAAKKRGQELAKETFAG
jgi:peptidoglycan/LPS O-acetylase OafA/YrhL